MFLKQIKKSTIFTLLMAAACLVVSPSSSLGASIGDLERLSASGTLQELKEAFSNVSADVVFPSGNNPLHVAAEHASDPAVISILVKHGAPLYAKGLEQLTPLMLAAAYNQNASIAEALIKAGAEAGVEVNTADALGRTPLHLAVATNRSTEVVETLLRHGATPNVRERGGRTPLWMATNRSNAQNVQLLLDAGARVDEPDNNGITPLLLASEMQNSDVLRLLLEAGANTNARGRNRFTPLMKAVTTVNICLDAIQTLIDGNAAVNAEDDRNRSAIHFLAARHDATPEILFALINAGANPNAMDSSLMTPLMEASRQRNTALVEALLEAGARVDLRDRNSLTPLLHAASRGAPLEIYELLKRAGACIDEPARNGASPLMLALDSEVDAEGIRALLDAGANPNYKRYDTVSVLMNAVAAYNVELVSILLEYGADPNQTTWDGLSPMMLAAQRVRDTAMFETLAQNGANINSRNNQGITALMVAVASGNAKAVESLILLGADLEVRDSDGFTSMFHAIQASGRNDYAIIIIELLISGGSDVNARDFTGATPLMHSALGGRRDVSSRLLAAGARIDVADSVGWTPLHFAARGPAGAGVADLLIRQLLQYDKCVDIPDYGATTPIMVAAAHNNIMSVRLLLEAGASFSRQDKTGRSAYEYASIRNALGARDVIREAMANPRS